MYELFLLLACTRAEKNITWEFSTGNKYNEIWKQEIAKELLSRWRVDVGLIWICNFNILKVSWIRRKIRFDTMKF